MNKPLLPSASKDPLIRVSGLVKNYSNGSGVIPVLREVNLQVARGEMIAVMGPSGSGKSTLLYILGLLLAPTSGSYHFAGWDVLGFDRAAQAEFRRHQVGFVFQDSDLLENSTVYENLEFPLIYAGVARGERPAKIAASLELVKLGHRLRHATNRLSGGERQRIAVARALINNPQVILADEPTGQLDRENGRLLMDHFEDIVALGEAAVVVVTHDPEVGARCSRVHYLEDGVMHDNRLPGRRAGAPPGDKLSG
jgi:putative ABC transport system ATP-binding protein